MNTMIQPSPSSISVAGFKQVYMIHSVESALNELHENANETLRVTYQKMLKAGGLRFSSKPSHMPIMDQLYEDLPNFKEPLDDIRKQLALCTETDDRLELAPMLLLGDPGIGKTHFAKQISKMLNTGFSFIAMSSLTAGWVLSGASSQWKNARPGKVFETLVHGEYANPVMVIDEIDKASGDSQYDPMGALYSLLEHDTASEFIDEFVEVPIDASDIVWIATANDMRVIPEPILNRVNVYHSPAPDQEGSCRIASSIYQEIREGHTWGMRFPENLSGDTLAKISELSPREMRRVILNGFGNARLAGRYEIKPEDIEVECLAKKSRIGFYS